MKVEVEGPNIRCYIDDMDTPLIRYTDPVPFITGRAGFRAHDSVMRFDNFVVTPATQAPDAITSPRTSASSVTPAPERIYNLQGQLVSPSPSLPRGLYIHSQGGASHKVLH